MRLFLFAVGGTGSRVLKPFIMLCAAGVHPIDEDGKPIKDLEVVPIIMDPHRSNEDLKRTDNLLRWYKEIRNKIYGDNTNVQEGFFSVKISTLNDIVKTDTPLHDSFLFDLSDIESKFFKDYIAYNTMSAGNQALCSLLFSEEQLMTKMGIGFVGNPNIGSVALNQFKDSNEFKQFASNFSKSDRIFIISSIFGGTGAAGYPVIVKNIRDAENNLELTNKADLANAAIGALTVMPYFNIENDPNSPINVGDFILKTKAALEYYLKNLTKESINVCYYLGDEVKSNAYKNDPGDHGQKNNAHLIEYVGALDIFHFLSQPDSQMKCSEHKAEHPFYYEYGLRKDTNDSQALTLKDFYEDSLVSSINKQMAKFHLAYMYLSNEFSSDIGKGYTNDPPEIRDTFRSSTFYRVLMNNFFGCYEEWLVEMQNNKRQFSPFNLATHDLALCLNKIPAKKSWYGGKVDYKDMIDYLNKQSKHLSKPYDSNQIYFKLIDLLDKVTTQLLKDKFQLQ